MGSSPAEYRMDTVAECHNTLRDIANRIRERDTGRGLDPYLTDILDHTDADTLPQAQHAVVELIEVLEAFDAETAAA